MFPEWVYVRGLPCAEYASAVWEGARGGTAYCDGAVAPHGDVGIGSC